MYPSVKFRNYYQSDGWIVDCRYGSFIYCKIHFLIVTTDFRENWAHVLSEDNENGIDYIEFVKVILGFDLTWVVELVEF